MATTTVLWLDDERAERAELTGAKAASLAKARRNGLAVMPGFAVTTDATGLLGEGRASPELDEALRAAWSALSDDGRRALVVRSSSTIEDGGSSSMAGMFTSVLDVRGWAAFTEAVASVLGSAKSVPGIERAPMGVLVQPLLVPTFGGVAFGLDPISGRADRRVVAAVEGGPDALVSGLVDGARYVLSPSGKVLESERPLPGLDKRALRSLVQLGASAARLHGGPQDIEWAIDAELGVVLLQSRPVTAAAATVDAGGPLLGPGPVAETFPAALSTLEADLWVAPLAAGVTEALTLVGGAPRRALRRSPVVTVVGGRVASDLRLLGAVPEGLAPRGARRMLNRLDPRPPARRLGAAWRVGRLRAALPALAGDVVADADARLVEVPALDALDSGQLLGLLRSAGPLLTALHGYEVLMGLLAPPASADGHGLTGAGVALWALADGRAQGMSDEDVIAERPAVLALVPPRISAAPVLPPLPAALLDAPPPQSDRGDDLALLREALRLRTRWVHELMARAAWELGSRLARTGRITTAEDVRHLTLDELDAATHGRAVPADLVERRDAPVAAPLPTVFRLSADRTPVPVVVPGSAAGGAGTGAGGGRGEGVVHVGEDTPPAGAVLVVRTLDPDLAPLLPGLGGLVSETGSVLSHLAILARELGVPTVVGVAGATERFPAGATVVVDGASGEVEITTPAGPEPDAQSPIVLTPGATSALVPCGGA